ncbi:MAG: SBBP repeat-containing protein [candidate division WOR-3 bacterium]
MNRSAMTGFRKCSPTAPSGARPAVGFWVLAVTFLAPVAFAQVDTAWTRVFNGPGSGSDEAQAMAVDRFGNVHVTGYGMGIATGYDYQTIKYSPDGNQQWIAWFTSLGSLTDQASAIAIDTGDNVFVTGSSPNPAGDYDFLTIKYSPSGIEQWVRPYNGPGASSDGARALAVDLAGNCYVTGYSTNSAGNYDILTLKYDPSGNLLWVSAYNGPANSTDYPNAILVDNLGNLYVTGYSLQSSGMYDYLTIKYRAATGETLWTRRYNGTGNGTDMAYALALDSAGNVIVTGASTGSMGADYDIVIVKYDPNGVTRWVTRYNGPGSDNDGGNAIGVDQLGNVYVAGYSTGAGTSYDLTLISYNQAGAFRWVRRYDGPVSGYDIGTALAIDSAANVYVTGYSQGSGSGYDYVTCRYDMNGNRQWLRRYNGAGNGTDMARSVSLDRWNNVYVTGSSYGGSSYGTDYLTIKYIQPDAAVDAILVPGGLIDSSQLIVPQVRVRNLGSATTNIQVMLRIRNKSGAEVYFDAAPANNVSPGDYATVSFNPWSKPYPLGEYSAFCSTWVAFDGVPQNDTMSQRFSVTAGPYGWVEVEPVPSSPSGRDVKDGGSLCFLAANSRVYALKAYKSGDFYAYNPAANNWQELNQVPPGPSNRLPKGGAVIADDDQSRIYLVKGNSTLEFYCYDLDSAKWIQLNDIPAGPSGKKVRSGSDMQFVMVNGTGYLYLLKGYRNEFYRFNTQTEEWENLPDAPTPVYPKWDKGSFLVYDEGDILYAGKAKTNEIFRFYISAGIWDSVPVTFVPFYNRQSGQSKKLKDGGCATWFQGSLYCLKGGNTCDFFQWTPSSNSWVELETLPSFGSSGKKKRVKAGADITSTGGAFYALKGNKTREMWRYALAPSPENSSQQGAGGSQPVPFRVRLWPNPARGVVLLTTTAGQGRKQIEVFDVSGRRLITTASEHSTVNIGTGRLPAGIYLVGVEQNGHIGLAKLIIQR